MTNLVDHQTRWLNEFSDFLSANFCDEFVTQLGDKLGKSPNSVINWVINFVNRQFWWTKRLGDKSSTSVTNLVNLVTEFSTSSCVQDFQNMPENDILMEQVSISPFLGIVGDKKCYPFLDRGVQSPFFAPQITENGRFWVQKMGLWTPYSENRDHYLSGTIPPIFFLAQKWRNRHLFHKNLMFINMPFLCTTSFILSMRYKLGL